MISAVPLQKDVCLLRMELWFASTVEKDMGITGENCQSCFLSHEKCIFFFFLVSNTCNIFFKWPRNRGWFQGRARKELLVNVSFCRMSSRFGPCAWNKDDWRILSTIGQCEKLLEGDGIWFSFCAERQNCIGILNTSAPFIKSHTFPLRWLIPIKIKTKDKKVSTIGK